MRLSETESLGEECIFAENVCGLLPVSHQLLLEITVSIRC